MPDRNEQRLLPRIEKHVRTVVGATLIAGGVAAFAGGIIHQSLRDMDFGDDKPQDVPALLWDAVRFPINYDNAAMVGGVVVGLMGGALLVENQGKGPGPKRREIPKRGGGTIFVNPADASQPWKT